MSERFYLSVVPFLIFFGVTCVMTGCGGRSVNIEKLLNTQDDFELCDQLFVRLTEHYGKDFDISKCKEKDQVVILVWHATGIIDNGGFQYLFEGNFKGDPHYARTADAFKTIQAKKCAEAVREALGLFPNSKPPDEVEPRLKAFQQIGAAKRESIDTKFFSESKEIRTHLARYIRDNRADFKHIK